MKRLKVNAKCPFEVGDYIRFEKAKKENVMKITDIIAETSVVRQETTFKLELDGWYILDLRLHEAKITSVENYTPQ